MEGTVTIPLKEYHRLLDIERLIDQFKTEHNTVLIHARSYHYSDLWVIRADEATHFAVERMKKEIAQLQERLKYHESKGSALRIKKWWELF